MLITILIIFFLPIANNCCWNISNDCKIRYIICYYSSGRYYTPFPILTFGRIIQQLYIHACSPISIKAPLHLKHYISVSQPFHNLLYLYVFILGTNYSIHSHSNRSISSSTSGFPICTSIKVKSVMAFIAW